MDFLEFTNFLDRLEASIRSASTPVLVAGDLNAKSPERGDTVRTGREASVSVQPRG